MLFFDEEFKLSKEEVVRVSAKCRESYEKTLKKKAIKTVEFDFFIEELLANLTEAYGEGVECRLQGIKSLGKSQFVFKIHGENIDPFDADDDMWFSKRFMQNYINAPIHRYDESKKENSIYIGVPKKPRKNKMMYQILEGAALAVIIALIIGLFPSNISEWVSQELVSPIFNKMTVIIGEFATPLVFVCVISGIAGVGSSSALGNMGKTFLKGMFFIYGIAAAALSLAAVLFFGISKVSVAGESGVFAQILQLVLDMIPNNLVECFLADNDLQVIVLAIFVGVVILSMGSKAKKILDAVHILEDLVNKLMLVICRLLPLIVFFGVLNIMFIKVSGIGNIYKVILAFLVCAAIIVLTMLIRTSKITGASIAKLFKVQLPTTLLNLTTSSQVGTFPENVRCCKEDIGLDSKLVDFCMPLGVVTYMPTGAAFLGLTAWCMAELTGTPIDTVGLIKIAIISVVVAIAAPPIPGSAFAVMPIIFAASGIPLNYYSVAIILGTLIGYFLPVLNGYCLQLEVIITGYKLNAIDPEKFAKFKRNRI